MLSRSDGYRLATIFLGMAAVLLAAGCGLQDYEKRLEEQKNG